jgi:replicative DNA helicase
MNALDLDYTEQCVIGGCLLDRTVIPQVIELLPNEDIFFNEANKACYRAIRKLYESGRSIDYLTVLDQLKKDKNDDIASSSHVFTLTSNVVGVAHIESHCLILKENYIRRTVAHMSNDISLKSLDDSEDILDILSDSINNLTDLSNLTAQKTEKRIDAIVATFFEKTTHNTKINLSFITDEIKAVSGQLIVLAARPSMGKTAFALQVAEFCANDGYSVGILSLEMTDEQLVMRLVSKGTGIPFDRLESKDIRSDEVEKHYHACEDISNLPIWIDDEANISDLQIKAKATRMKVKYNINLLLVDYLQLAHSKQSSREQEIASISRTLKGLAKSLNIPVIALSQLSRKVEERSDKRPLLSDLRESGAIEQDADQVWFMFRPDYYGLTEFEGEKCEGMCELIVSKNRNGKLGRHKMRFNGSKFEFEKWDNFVKIEQPF